MDEKKRWQTNVNYFETWRLIVEGADESEIHEFDGLLITDCGLSFAFFNVAFVQLPLTEPDKSIKRALSHFTIRNLPGLICFPPGLDDRTETLVASQGYSLANPHPGMTLAPIPLPPEPPAELGIRTVDDDVMLSAFQETAEAGFGFPLSLPQHLLSSRFRDHPNVTMFLGYIDERPVCTSILVVTGSIAGIYWVSTRPDFRGRGIGSAMSWHAVKAGLDVGCELATLQASAMGRPIYE